MTTLADVVAASLRDAGERAIVPRFRALESSAIAEKAPGEWVTDADHEAEALITAALQTIDPGVPVVGEEAAAANADLLTQAGAHDRVWVLDPLDGTKAFIGGSPDVATMAALVEHGRTTASWIWQPLHGRMFTATRGSGAFADGVRLSPPTARGQHMGVLRTRFMPPELRAMVLAGADAARLERADVSAAGIVYPMLARGELAHALFWRTLPWDHAPGTLLAEEVGLVVARPDGSDYRPFDARPGVLTATDQGGWDAVRGVLPADLSAHDVS